MQTSLSRNTVIASDSRVSATSPAGGEYARGSMAEPPVRRGLIARNRQSIERDLRNSPARMYVSALLHSQYRTTVPLAQRHAAGRLLDIGAGFLPYRQLIESRVECYHSLDCDRHVDEIDFLADAQQLEGVIEDATYDTVLLFEVLEHVPNPAGVISEVHRILRPGGKLILSVPHLSRLHAEPHDYFRYTKYGLAELLKRGGFQEFEIVARGGLFSFLAHQVSTIVLGLTWGIPVVRRIAFSLNRWLITLPAVALDRVTDESKLFAAGYSAVARKV